VSIAEAFRHAPFLNAARRMIQETPYPVVFATLSGAHLYGFASPQSDVDVRGCHVLPEKALMQREEYTLETTRHQDHWAMDWVSHDVQKFVNLLLRPNGYVLEQLYSPLVVSTTAAHAELKELGQGCITRAHVRHYLGLAYAQWKTFERHDPPQLKPLLYVFRALLSGIHLMQTGQIEANLPRLNEAVQLPYLPDLMAQKRAGVTVLELTPEEVRFYQQEFEHWVACLHAAHQASTLPDGPSAQAALQAFSQRLRNNSL
jgi:predicted nucleotidyltransferase